MPQGVWIALVFVPWVAGIGFYLMTYVPKVKREAAAHKSWMAAQKIRQAARARIDQAEALAVIAEYCEVAEGAVSRAMAARHAAEADAAVADALHAAEGADAAAGAAAAAARFLEPEDIPPEAAALADRAALAADAARIARAHADALRLAEQPPAGEGRDGGG